MRALPVLIVAFVAVASFACTNSNNSSEETASPTALGESSAVGNYIALAALAGLATAE